MMKAEQRQIVWMELYLAVVKCCEEDRSAYCDAFAVERRNHLGSVTRIYNTSGTAVFSAQYDPWGVQTVTTNTIKYNRGYCGHEMLNDFQLINMNGRMYDPYLGRFLSPDNYVQLPTSAQSFNRYSYCLNNPLKYVDPEGESLFFTIAFSILGAYLGGSIANDRELNPFQWNYSSFDTYLGIGVGAIIGGFGGYGIDAPGSINYVFNLSSPWVSAGVTVGTGTIAAGASSDWKFDFHWSTVAGGRGTTEYSQSKNDKKVSDIYDKTVNRMRESYQSLRNMERNINTMANSFVAYGTESFRNMALNINNYYIKPINRAMTAVDIMMENTPKEKFRKGAVSFGEKYGARYGGMFVGDIFAGITTYSGYGLAVNSTAGALGYSFGATIGDDVGGFVMGELFDLSYSGYHVLKTLKRINPKMKWIEQQNRMLQNMYYYKAY